MPLVNEEFTRCPARDSDLKGWAYQYPELMDVFFGNERNYQSFVSALSNLKTVDPVNNSIVEYGFTEEEIKDIAECYKDNDWDLSNIFSDIKLSRDTSETENSYINNIIKPWTDYKVPAINTKEHYEMREYNILRYVEFISESGEPQFGTKEVCRSPFVVCGISEPLNGEDIYYKIRYKKYSGEIKEFWASQSDLLSRKELKNLFLSHGINCPENALLMETMDYISRSISEFGPCLKKEYSAKQNGWNEDKSIFILGNRAITSAGIEPILSVGGRKGFPELERKGSLAGWIEGTKEIMSYDLIRFKCYDAMSAPLKAILGIESHATDHYGNTSCGKTFSAQIALSMIGDAEELTIGAKSTSKGILVHIRDFSDLPILIDESSDAGEHLADLVYPLTSNKGRVKSTVDGQRDGGEEFHTTTMFTGERPIRDCLTNSGQQYRVNELDDTLPDLPTKKINAVKATIRENHGHIIEMYIQKIFEWRDKGYLQVTYDNCFDTLPENNSNIEGRSRSIFACIMTAGKVLEAVFKEIGMPTKAPLKIVESFYKRCIQDKPVELEYIRALRITLDWVQSEYGRFGQVEMVDVPKAADENQGFDRYVDPTKIECVSQHDKNKRYGYVDSEFIDIIGTEFTTKMKSEGFSPSKIKEDWWQRGIVDGKDATRKGTCRFSRGGKTIVGVRIFRRVAEELAGVTEKNIKDEKLPQDKTIMKIIETIKFLTYVKGEADLNIIRLITEIQDLDALLNILSINGKILKISQTSYKSI